jgi:phasin family protein
MHAGISEFLDEQTQGLVELVETFRKARVKAAREAALESAARIKALNQRVRALAKSGVRLSSISQGAAERLIELQSDIVTAALDDAAAQLKRLADTEHVRDLTRGQAEILQATRQRIVEDIARAVGVLKDAAGDVRTVANRSAQAAPVKRSKAAKPRKPAKRVARKVPAKARVRTAVRPRRSRQPGKRRS